MDEQFETRKIVLAFENGWNQEKLRRKESASLVRVATNFFGSRLVCMQAIHTFSFLLPILAVFTLKEFITETARSPGSAASAGLMLLIFGLLFVGLLAMQYASLNLNQTGVALRKGLTGLLFAKALRLSLSSVAEATTGKLINLCSGDMALIESYVMHLPQLVTGPSCTLLAFFLLYLTVGSGPTFFVLLLALILFCIQFPVNALILRLRLRISQASDRRLGLLHTLVKGILTVKGYGWEQPLTAQATADRQEEMRRLRRFHQLSGCFQGLL